MKQPELSQPGERRKCATSLRLRRVIKEYIFIYAYIKERKIKDYCVLTVWGFSGFRL